VAPGIRVVPPDDPAFDELWDALPVGGIRTSASWLRSAQRRVGGRAAAVLAPRRSGLFLTEIRPGAHAFHDPAELLFGGPARDLVPDYLGPHRSNGAATSQHTTAIVARPDRQELYPAAVVAVPYGCQFSLRGADPAGAVLDGLVDGCLEVAASWGARTLGFLYLTPQDDRLFAGPLADRGFLAGRTDARFSTSVRWADFDAYVARLASRNRKTILREVVGFNAHGLVLSSMRLTEAGDELLRRLAELSAMTQARHGHPFDSAAEFRVLKANQSDYGAHTQIVLASKQDTVVGFTTFYDWNGEYTAGMFGQDYQAVPSGAFVHFNVVYYEALRLAMASGAHVLHFGIGAGMAKVTRGADAVPLRSYFRVPDDVLPAATATAAELNATAGQIIDEFRRARPWRAA
jgi:predicted N-acyltransferase